MDPAHPLPAVADAASQSHLERRQHGTERAVFGAENDSRPQVRSANVSLYRRHGRFLPLLANLAEKSGSRSAFLTQQFVAAIAVIADRRTGDKYLRLFFCLCQSS